ncbi:MAG: hypothetical protein OEY94_03855 [Alphaproteobacteria bacterium]|nr:hypothetical protein [Alphaproteobacteria bacterium]
MNDDLDEEIIGSDGEFDEFVQKSSLGDVIRTNPAAKVGIVVLAVGVIILIAWFFGGAAEVENPSSIPKGSKVTAPPGTNEATPAYVEAVEQKNEDELERAIQTGESAIPVPIESPEERLTLPEEKKEEEDPLHKWRRIQEERVEREMRERQSVEAVTVLDSEQQNEAIKNLSESMSKQMESVLTRRAEKATFTYIGMVDYEDDDTTGRTGPGAGPTPNGNGGGAFQEETEETIIIPTGTIEYAQMLLEANSDIEGPVMALLLTGPLKGSRMMGSFTVQEDKYLVVNFTTAVVDGKDVPISAIMLDPDTTLAGMATDVNNHYFKRIVLPAASAFIGGMAGAIAETGRTSVIVSGDNVVESTGEPDNDQEVATGIEEAADEITEIIDDIADVEPTVIIRAGTPMGVLFTSPVIDEESDI